MSIEPAEGLFERIILAIKREEVLRHTRRLAVGFLLLLIVSCAAAPFSFGLLINQVRYSGLLYFVSAGLGDIGLSLAIWKDLILAMAEALPLLGVIVFAVNMMVAVFTVRLFLYKKRLLLNYLTV
jgi:hypothetical protein